MTANPNPQAGANRNEASNNAVIELVILQRAREIAFLNGRSSRETMESDVERAKRELEDTPSAKPKDMSPGCAPGHDTQILIAQTRTAQAEARTEQAELRTAQAETRIEQAEARTDQAKIRTEQAEARTEQAEARTDQAKTRTEQAEARTEKAEARIEELQFHPAKDGILILDADTGQINDVNPFMIAMLGFSKGELISKPIWELGPFRDLVSNKTRFEHLREQGYVRCEDLPIETKDGRNITVEFVSNVYPAGGRNVVQCTVRDVTERKQMEEKVHQLNAELEQRVAERTCQLQSANEDLQAFSYSVSHDLHSPLRHIIGFMDMLQKDTASNLSKDGFRYLTNVSEAAKRMEDLIDDLLAFARLGRAEMQVAEVSLDELVRETLGDPQLDTKERNIAWDIRPLPSVRGDRALLRMVLTNLISNAIKFTKNRAQAKIEIGSAPGDGNETVIFIRDNGAGFDPNYAHKLFGVFQRLHSHDDFEGTGIGLANVQRIICRHGGRVWAEGVVDGGATFYFSIPKQATQASIKNNGAEQFTPEIINQSKK